jgi:phage baseplate assembly protein W
MQIDYPYHVDGRGRTAETSESDHVRDMIEQLLFTTPGERVNRPDFGSGLLQLVFAPAGTELAATTQFLVQAGLQQWLGDRIRVDAVEVGVVDSTLTVTVVYTLARTGQREVSTFTRSV